MLEGFACERSLVRIDSVRPMKVPCVGGVKLPDKCAVGRGVKVPFWSPVYQNIAGFAPFWPDRVNLIYSLGKYSSNG
jgi:hypothetical protein